MTTTESTTPKERHAFGLDVARNDLQAGVIARPTERSMSGNFIFEAGQSLASGGWYKTLHIVLTPDEAAEFHAALGKLLDEEQS